MVKKKECFCWQWKYLLSLIHFTQINYSHWNKHRWQSVFWIWGRGAHLWVLKVPTFKGLWRVVLPKKILKSWSLEILLSLFYFLLCAWNLCPWNNRPFYNLWMTLLWLETSLLLFFKFLLIIIMISIITVLLT